MTEYKNFLTKIVDAAEDGTIAPIEAATLMGELGAAYKVDPDTMCNHVDCIMESRRVVFGLDGEVPQPGAEHVPKTPEEMDEIALLLEGGESPQVPQPDAEE